MIGRVWDSPSHRREQGRMLFLSCLHSEKEELQVSLVTMSHPSLRTVPHSCLPLDMIDSLKKDMRLLDGGF
jgi:hypothetical protein